MSYSYYDTKPYHPLNLNWWSVFPKEQNKVISYGRFKLYWENVLRRTRRHAWESDREIIKWISVDDNSYSEYTYSWQSKNKDLSNELNGEIQKARSVLQKARAKERAKERKILNEQLAKKLGITIEELRAKNKKNREAKQEQKKGSEVTKQMDGIITAGPVIKNLYDDLGNFLTHLNSGGQVNITHVSRKIEYFRYVQKILEQWRYIPKSKRKPK